MVKNSPAAFPQPYAVANALQADDQMHSLPTAVRDALVEHGYTSARQVIESSDAALIRALHWTPSVGAKTIAAFTEWLALQRRIAGQTVTTEVDVKVGAERVIRGMREQLAMDLVKHMVQKQVRPGDLAKLAATSEPTVLEMIRGTPPGLEVLVRMSVALGLQVQLSTTIRSLQFVCEVD
ncbi:hypothetical protein [Paucibacter soli]|uniref:hypothetical protein n=1 Tax=Paucibacter soli TaxID=3133433 RepID=UPI0030AB45D3